jgi:hypothetical protein
MPIVPPARSLERSLAFLFALVSSVGFGRGSARADGAWTGYPWPAPAAYPAATAAPGFNDWPQYAYDNQHTGYNPNTTAFTPAATLKLHLAWSTPVYGYAQTQPLLLTNIGTHKGLLVVGSAGDIKTYDALTGTFVWQTHLGQQFLDPLCGVSSLGGTPRYDPATKSLYVASGNDSTTNHLPANHVIVSRLDATTGAITGRVDITPSLLKGEYVFTHGGLTLANGLLYVGTSSSCDDASWRGRVVVLQASTLTVLRTFYTVWNAGPHPGAYSGGGVWGWGGVSVDPLGDVYVGVGNADTNTNAGGNPGPQPPFATTNDEQAGYGENVVKLSSDLSHVYAADYPGFNFAVGYEDLDFAGTPVYYQPPNCPDPLLGTQGKGGVMVSSDARTLQTRRILNLSKPDSGANYMGNPAYSPLTTLLYASVNSSQDSLFPPGMVAIGDCGTGIIWHAAFGADSFTYSSANGGEWPRTAPLPTAGGVVFLGVPDGPTSSVYTSLWALDAQTGAILGGKPVFSSGGNYRMAPVVDGQWMYLFDGTLYGLTVDPSVPAAARRSWPRVPHWAWHERVLRKRR